MCRHALFVCYRGPCTCLPTLWHLELLKQEWILDLFRRYGYTEDLEFEGYVLSFNFHQ